MIQRLSLWLIHRGLDLASNPLTLALSEEFSAAEARRQQLLIALSDRLGERLGLCSRARLVKLYRELSELERGLESLRAALAPTAGDEEQARGGGAEEAR